MKALSTTLALLIAAAATEAGIAPAGAADAEEGRRLAKQWCSECHLTGADQAAGGDAAPPFATIAGTAADRTDDLRAWLADPHPPMPNLDLTRSEIDALLAYIESLNDD